jgi:hypothetical protein
MCVRIGEIDLTKLRRIPLDCALRQHAKEIVVFDIVLESIAEVLQSDILQ